MISPRQPAATVAICTLNRADQLAKCLQHVTALDYPQFDVLVIDNGDNDATAETARRFGVQCIRSVVPGLSRARNDAARSCRSEIIAYIDDDAIPERDWLAALATEFEDPAVMAVAGHIQPPEDFARHGVARKVDQSTPDWFSITNFGGIGDGGNMAFRMSAFSAWAGFDERLGLGSIICAAEEHRAFFSLVALGGCCVSTPNAVVRHRDTWSGRRASNFEAAIAYSLLLFSEEPRWRPLLLKHAAKHLLSKRRSWREHRALPSEEPLNFSEKVRAALAGARLYSRAAKIGRSAAPLLRTSPGTAAP